MNAFVVVRTAGLWGVASFALSAHLLAEPLTVSAVEFLAFVAVALVLAVMVDAFQPLLTHGVISQTGGEVV